MYKHSIFFFYNIHDSIIPCIERERYKKKLFKHVCVELRSEPIDCWYLYRHLSFLFYVWFQWHQDACYWFFFLSFFFCVCELNKMLVSYIFIVENLVWLCWVFFIKWQIPKCLNFYIIIQMCSPSLLCVCVVFFLNEYKIKILTLVFFLNLCSWYHVCDETNTLCLTICLILFYFL